MTRAEREQIGALAADPVRWAEWLRATQRERARALGVALPDREATMRVDGVPGVVLAEHTRRRMWDTRKYFGGLGESAAGQLAAAMAVDGVGGGSYDLALRNAGREPTPLTYARTSDEIPRPYDIGLAAARRAGGAR